MNKVIKIFKIVSGVFFVILISMYLIGLWQLRAQNPAQEWLQLKINSSNDTSGLQVASRFGCTSCHGNDLSGGKAWGIPAAMAHIQPPSLLNNSLSDEDWIKAVRLGLGSDNRPLLMMPSKAYTQISDQELRTIIDWSRRQSTGEFTENKTSLGFLGPILVAVGMLELSNRDIDNDHIMLRVQPKATVAYGQTLAQICMQCHGNDLAGKQPTSHGPPGGPDIRGSQLLNQSNGWNVSTFAEFFTTGHTPNGKKVSGAMPWKSLGFGYQEPQLKALWLYLNQL